MRGTVHHVGRLHGARGCFRRHRRAVDYLLPSSLIAVRRYIFLAGATVVAFTLTVLALRDLDWIARGQVVAAAGLLAYALFLVAREATGRLHGSAALRRTNERLETEIDRRTRDFADANARLRSIIDSAVDCIIVIDSRGRIESFNPAAQRLFGYPESEVLGRNVSMLMPLPYHEEHDRYLERYLTTGEARIIGIGREVVGRRRDGTVFPVHLSVGEMLVGGERKFTGMLHDLTARVELEERLRASEGRWRSIVQSAVDGIVVIDAYGRIEAFNAAAERLFGYSEQEVLGQNVNILMPQPYRDEHDRYLARYLATGVKKIIGTGREVAGQRRDGTTFPLHLSVGEITVGGEPKFTGIVHDLSARVAMEVQLREQTALARLGEMAAVIAHEVKNPLAGIRGAIQVIGNRLPDDARERATVKEIIARIDALNDLMKDLLLFARPPKPRPTPVDLLPLVSSTADLLAQDPALKDIRVDVEGSAPPILGDPEMLRIVFHNLLVNCAHAMQGRGTIRVGIGTLDTTCQIAFADSGPGIPPEIRDKVFTAFFTTKARGSGLGLATAKRFVDAHRGHIEIDCPPGGGTVVTVQLPTQTS
jgi:two-component system sensor kinase FixL